MGIFSISLDPFILIGPCFGYLGAQVDYYFELDDNLDGLNSALEDLKAKRVDMLRKIDAEELKGRRRLDEVERWLSKVNTIETKTNLLVHDAAVVQHGLCCTNIISTYRLGKKISKMLDKIKIFTPTNLEFVVLTGPPRPPVVEDNLFKQTFGLDTKLHSTWNLLLRGGIRMLGVYGMGGVGKTTLLSLINNNCVEAKEQFDVVIWVKVSKDVDIAKIQDDIGESLGLYDENWCTKSQRGKARDIHRVLKNKKPRFVLLLDDLWKELSLSDIGIPVLGSGYKVVFTTRFRDVCGIMEADEDIEVECLAEESAWDLFEKKARCSEFNGEISDIARKIAAKCCGLPLALEVIGKTLASKTTVDEWRRALSTLESSPSEWKGTENGIFQVLKLSYDNLGKEDELCFQYCALFPKAYNIKQDELVEYWIGEGFIDAEDGRQKAKDRGYEIINTLVEASLLLEDGESKQKVYMHNMIREMAFWIVVGKGHKYVVETGAGLTKLPEIKNWKAVTKMSLMNNEIESIIDCPRFPNPDRLVTLFLQNNKLADIVGRFFQVLSTLVVLDLSGNLGITELPGGISVLVLRFYRSASLDHLLLESLERLGDLELLTITIEEDFEVLKGFLGSNSAGRTQGLYLNRLEVSGVLGKSFAATFGELGSLSKLGMTDCDIIESETIWEDNRRTQSSPSTSSNQFTLSNTWFKNLSTVVLLSCQHLQDLTWLTYAANLESLSVKISPNMEEVISKEKAGVVEVEPFRKLQVLDFDYLDKLKSIYWSPLSFPRLKEVVIKNCPNLRKLPLNSTSVERIDDLIIKVDEGWLEEVEWESEAAKERFLPVCLKASVSQLHPV